MWLSVTKFMFLSKMICHAKVVFVFLCGTGGNCLLGNHDELGVHAGLKHYTTSPSNRSHLL